MFGWLSVDHLFATLNQPNITTKKTKMMSNTQPTKHYNKENKKGEQHSTNQTLQQRKLKWVLLTILVFFVVMFGWLSIAHLFSFLFCNVWLVEC
jgi:cytoskeletal protein RodZ